MTTVGTRETIESIVPEVYPGFRPEDYEKCLREFRANETEIVSAHTINLSSDDRAFRNSEIGYAKMKWIALWLKKNGQKV